MSKMRKEIRSEGILGMMELKRRKVYVRDKVSMCVSWIICNIYSTSLSEFSNFSEVQLEEKKIQR